MSRSQCLDFNSFFYTLLDLLTYFVFLDFNPFFYTLLDLLTYFVCLDFNPFSYTLLDLLTYFACLDFNPFLYTLLDLLTYFASQDVPFLMECCRRTEADKKGGHLAVRTSDGQLILRESAQCAKEDEAAFQDTNKHKYFNTNNLWVRLDLLKILMDSKGGFVPLPTLLNGKTVDPQQVINFRLFCPYLLPNPSPSISSPCM